MTLNVDVGSFAKSTGAAPATQDVALPFPLNTGNKFVIILFMAGGTVSGTFRASLITSYGYATGLTEEVCLAATSPDAQATTDTFVIVRSDRILTIIGTGGAEASTANLTGLDPGGVDGFRLQWSPNGAQANLVHYIVLEGSDLTEAFATTWTPDLTTGGVSVSNTALGFQPDLLIGQAGKTGTANAIQPSASRIIGFCDKDLNQVCSVGLANDGQPAADTNRSHTVIRWIQDSIANLELEVTSFDVNGFTVFNHNAHPATRIIPLLAIKLAGQRVKAGIFAKPTGAAPAAADVALSFTPDAVLLMGDQLTLAARDLENAHWRQTIGASDGSSQQGVAYADQNAADPTNVDAVDYTDQCLIKVDNATATVEAECAVTVGVDKFTHTWDPNDAVAAEYGYLALAEAPAGGIASRRMLVGVGR